jgi:hypothetical protein
MKHENILIFQHFDLKMKTLIIIPIIHQCYSFDVRILNLWHGNYNLKHSFVDSYDCELWQIGWEKSN